MAKLLTQLQIRRDSSARLNSVILAEGELAYATDTKRFAVGDGSNTFLNLPKYATLEDLAGIAVIITDLR